MNKFFVIVLFVIFSLLFVDGVLVVDVCGMLCNVFDSVYCCSGEFFQVDCELNQQFGILCKYLNDGQKVLLKKSQIVWIKECDVVCSESKDNGYFVNFDCVIEKICQCFDFFCECECECLSIGCVDVKF